MTRAAKIAATLLTAALLATLPTTTSAEAKSDWPCAACKVVVP